MPVYLDGVGTARALNTVTVKPQVDGKLIAISFIEGQDVPKGFVLAKIDPTTYQAQYDQAVAKKAQDEAQLANAQARSRTLRPPVATNAINKQQVDTQRALVAQLEAQIKSDQAAIDNARAILSYTDVTAPIAGRTGIRLVDEGNIVEASDTTGIVVITQLQPISVFFSLPQQVLPELNRGIGGRRAAGRRRSAPTARRSLDSGKVVVIDNQVDPDHRHGQIKAEFPNARLQLWPGQFVNVRLLIDTLRQVVVVPTAAVQRGPNGTFVYRRADDSTVGMRPVTVAQQDDRQAVIASGLTAGERVVTTGFARLTDGTRVAVTAAPNAPDSRRTRHRPRGQSSGTAEERQSRAAARRKGSGDRSKQSARQAGHAELDRHERLLALHPSADRDFAARDRGSCSAGCSAISGCRSRRCRRSISPPSR